MPLGGRAPCGQHPQASQRWHQRQDAPGQTARERPPKTFLVLPLKDRWSRDLHNCSPKPTTPPKPSQAPATVSLGPVFSRGASCWAGHSPHRSPRAAAEWPGANGLTSGASASPACRGAHGADRGGHRRPGGGKNRPQPEATPWTATLSSHPSERLPGRPPARLQGPLGPRTRA